MLALLATNLSAGTIGTQISSLGGNAYRETFLISGFTFTAGQELDIFFDPSLYGLLSNGVANPSSDWSLLLFQPNNPPGASGDYAATVLVNNPSLAGPFRVDFTYLGTGQPSGQLSYTVFNSDFSVNTTGVTGAPEPSALAMAAIGLIALGAFWLARRLHVSTPAAVPMEVDSADSKLPV